MELPGYESEKPQTYMKGVKSRAIVDGGPSTSNDF
jgi:hypothetical protein